MTVLRSDRLTAGAAERGIPDATVARLPVYLRALTTLAEQGSDVCSSHQLASAAGVNPAKLRKDLSYLGSYGTRGVGYDVEYLRYQIARELGQTQDWDVVIVGVGHLGSALSTYRGFTTRGIRIAALIDTDPDRIGTEVGGITVEPMSHLSKIVRKRHIAIAVIATPAEAAQQVAGIVVRPFDDLEQIVRENAVAIGVISVPAFAAQDVADRMVAAGISSILNFAPTVLSVPPGVDVRKVDLSIELQILSFHEQRKSTAPRLPADGVVFEAASL